MKKLPTWIKRLGEPPKQKRATPDAHTFALREVPKKLKASEQARVNIEPSAEVPKQRKISADVPKKRSTSKW